MTHTEFLTHAYEIATMSPDPSTQNGAVIKVGEELLAACNTFPNGVNQSEERLVRPLKYQYIEHAERGVILLAAKLGVRLQGCTMYVPWFACADCARAIICSGIKEVIGHKRMMDLTPDHWKESIENAFIMFKEAGVSTVLLDEELPDAPQIRFNGQLWQP